MNPFDFVAGVDHDRFGCCLIAKYGAIALQNTDRKGLENHMSIVVRAKLFALPKLRDLQPVSMSICRYRLDIPPALLA